MDKHFAARRRRDLIVAAVLAALAALAPLFVKDVYVQNILILTLMYAALSQSWNILSGYCGQISLGHALYFGIGAYATELLFTKFGVLPWFGMLAGGLFAAAIAMVLGYPFFRLRGHYFVIATIVIAEIGLLLFQNWEWAGAAMGITIPVRGDSWLSLARRDVDSHDVVCFRAQGADVVTRAAAGDKNLAGQWSLLGQEVEQGRVRFSFFPWRLPAAIEFVPIGLRVIHGCG